MPMSAAPFAECPRFPETRFEFRPKQSPAKQLRACQGSPLYARYRLISAFVELSCSNFGLSLLSIRDDLGQENRLSG